MERTVITETGCYLDSHRGHYAVPAMVELAVEYGFIVSSFEEYVLSRYDEDNHKDGYPHEELLELADEALTWLNAGDNSGLDRPIAGQNSPPVIPAGYVWEWNDGDFGLYVVEEDDD